MILDRIIEFATRDCSSGVKSHERVAFPGGAIASLGAKLSRLLEYLFRAWCCSFEFSVKQPQPCADDNICTFLPPMASIPRGVGMRQLHTSCRLAFQAHTRLATSVGQRRIRSTPDQPPPPALTQYLNKATSSIAKLLRRPSDLPENPQEGAEQPLSEEFYESLDALESDAESSEPNVDAIALQQLRDAVIRDKSGSTVLEKNQRRIRRRVNMKFKKHMEQNMPGRNIWIFSHSRTKQVIYSLQSQLTVSGLSSN
jgi:hypothetical protein